MGNPDIIVFWDGFIHHVMLQAVNLTYMLFQILAFDLGQGHKSPAMLIMYLFVSFSYFHHKFLWFHLECFLLVLVPLSLCSTAGVEVGETVKKDVVEAKRGSICKSSSTTKKRREEKRNK